VRRNDAGTGSSRPPYSGSSRPSGDRSSAPRRFDGPSAGTDRSSSASRPRSAEPASRAPYRRDAAPSARPPRSVSPTSPARQVDPEIDSDVVPADLPREVRAELRSASKPTADFVACHLVMAGRLIDDDPRLAYAHADAARRRLPRVAGVREAMGLCAYACEEWAEALSELRAARRMSGSNEHLAVMADCERGLGRPDRALALAAGPEVATLDAETAVEMRLVVAGARRDLGQLDSAVVSLQGPDLDPARRDPWSVRLFYAYADALLAAGRTADARSWFVHTAVADIENDTDAAERIDLIDGLQLGDVIDVSDVAGGNDETLGSTLFLEVSDIEAPVTVVALPDAQLSLLFEAPDLD
jgi:hypothetical protein